MSPSAKDGREVNLPGCSSQMSWNHAFTADTNATLMNCIYVALKSRFVPCPNQLTAFIAPLDAMSVVNYYKTLDDDTDIKNSIDQLAMC